MEHGWDGWDGFARMDWIFDGTRIGRIGQICTDMLMEGGLDDWMIGGLMEHEWDGFGRYTRILFTRRYL